MRLCEAKVKSGDVRRNQQRVTTKMAVGNARNKEFSRLNPCHHHIGVGTISAA